MKRTVIVRHIGNIYWSGELEEGSTCANNAQVQNEGGRMVERVQKYYNLCLERISTSGIRFKTKGHRSRFCADAPLSYTGYACYL